MDNINNSIRHKLDFSSSDNYTFAGTTTIPYDGVVCITNAGPNITINGFELHNSDEKCEGLILDVKAGDVFYNRDISAFIRTVE